MGNVEIGECEILGEDVKSGCTREKKFFRKIDGWMDGLKWSRARLSEKIFVPYKKIVKRKKGGRLAQVKDFIFYWIICRRLINQVKDLFLLKMKIYCSRLINHCCIFQKKNKVKYKKEA